MLAATTLLATGVNVGIAEALGWAGRIQIFPLAMASGITALAVWLVATLLFGRIYCSTVCPLGTVMDIFSYLPRRKRRWRECHPYHHAEPSNKLRYTILWVTVFCALGGIAAVTALLDPYAVFNRTVSGTLRPLVSVAAGEKVVACSVFSFLTAVTILAVVGFFAWRRGRIICNTICPVGSALSIPARMSLFHFDIDTDLCVNCRKCEHVCKAQCISMADHTVDASRCVVCFDCMDACDDGAIRYTTRRKHLATPMMRRVQPKIGVAANTTT